MDMITLTRVTSELLLLFVENNSIPLHREFILTELWEKKGLNASSNNLNNYVSMLRKALGQCGCTDVITTIPKHGFIFEADIVRIGDGDKFGVSEASPDADLQSLTLLEPVIERPPVRNPFSSRKVIGMVIVLSLLIIVFSPKIYDYFKLQSVRTEFFTYEQCQFYLTDDKTREIATSQIISNLKVNAEKLKLNCAHKVNVYYFADNKVDASGHVVLTDLISYCPYNSKAPCDNYYLTRHKKEDDNEK